MLKKSLLLFAVFASLGVSRMILGPIHDVSFLLANKIVNSSLAPNNVALAEEFGGSTIRDGSLKNMDSYAVNTPRDTAVATITPSDSTTRQIDPSNRSITGNGSVLSTFSVASYTKPNTSI